MIESKKDIRERYLRQRLELTSSDVAQRSKGVFRKIIGLGEITKKNNFALYLATKNEVDTKPIINKLVTLGKNVFLPRYFESEKTYFFVRFSDFRDLEVGYWGILQPKNRYPRPKGRGSRSLEIEVVFVPGIAFDRKGTRLGWGMGVYDRLLKDSKALKIGLAYDFQIVSTLAREEHDIKVDLVVTDKRTLKTSTI